MNSVVCEPAWANAEMNGFRWSADGGPQLSRADVLTGLSDRSVLGDRAQHALARQSLGAPGRVCVMLLDLDELKLLNASLGYELGNELLIEVAHRLRRAVPGDATVARVGGDEFGIISVVGSPAGAARLAERVVGSLAEPVPVQGRLVRTSASLGLALSPPNCSGQLMHHADIALFAAKSAGRGGVRIFDDRLAAQAEEAYQIVNGLASALQDSSLRLHYQPVVDLSTGAVLGYEALARWQHPQVGAIPPNRFVPVVERAGLSKELDRWVVDRALSEFSRLRSDGTVDQSAYIAVNLSAQELGYPDVEHFLVDAVRRSDLPPRNVTFEVTEGAIMHDQAEAARLLSALRNKGLGVALDDFGTGQSSLANLRKLPVSVIKMDRAFIVDMVDDKDALAIVTCVLNVARAIGLPVVAEGVEHLGQAAELRRLGCTSAQGWLWSAARPPAELREVPRRFPTSYWARPKAAVL